MQRLIVVFFMSMIMVNIRADVTVDLSFISAIDSQGRSFFFTSGNVPYNQYDQVFSFDQLKSVYSKLLFSPKAVLESLGQYDSYGCSHKNLFKDGVSTEMERAIIIPKAHFPRGDDPVSLIFSKVSEHLSSPTGKPLLGTLESYLYGVNESGKVVNIKKYVNDELGAKLEIDRSVRIKYCLDLPLIDHKCNTIQHRPFKVDNDTQVLFSSMVDLKHFPDSKVFFEHEKQRQNVNDHGNGILLVKKVGDYIVIYERSIYHSSQGSAVKEFKLFDKKISRDQCEKNTSLLIRRLGLENLRWKDFFSK